MKTACPQCNNEVSIKLSDKNLLFTMQTCESCQQEFTQLLRNVRIQDGKLIGEIVDPDEVMHDIGPEEETNDGK
jgi:transcription elongation factor Elf1